MHQTMICEHAPYLPPDRGAVFGEQNDIRGFAEQAQDDLGHAAGPAPVQNVPVQYADHLALAAFQACH